MANIGFKRFVSAFQSNRQLLQMKSRSGNQCRNSGGYAGYREVNYEPNRPFIQRLMHFNAAVMWCYIYWSFRHNWRELVGEKIWPNRDLWTNDELGIPGDYEEV